MGKAVKARVRTKRKMSPHANHKVHTESEIDLQDDVSIQEKMKTLMFDAPLPVLSASLDKLHYQESRTPAEDSLLESLHEAHCARLLAFVLREEDSALVAQKQLILMTPRPLKRSDRNIYRAISKELRERAAFEGGGVRR